MGIINSILNDLCGLSGFIVLHKYSKLMFLVAQFIKHCFPNNYPQVLYIVKVTTEFIEAKFGNFSILSLTNIITLEIHKKTLPLYDYKVPYLLRFLY